MKGHADFMDRYYSSFSITNILHNKTDTKGTLKANRKGNGKRCVHRSLKFPITNDYPPSQPSSFCVPCTLQEI